MLKYVSVKNFGPFKDKVEWFGDTLNNRNSVYYDGRLTSMAMIFGKNMSGKTSFIEALKFIKELLGGEGKVKYGYTDYYYNGPKDGVQYRSESSEFVIEFATHEKLYHYEIDVNLKDRSIYSEVLWCRSEDNKRRKITKIYTRTNYTDVKLYVDFGELGKWFSKYFNDIDETLLHRITCFSGYDEIEEIVEPYLYMRNTLKFIDDENFVITETGLNLEEMFIPNLMDNLNDLGIPVDGYYTIDCSSKEFFIMNGGDNKEEIKRVLEFYEGDSVNVIICNKRGVFIISNTTSSVYKCVRLKFSKNDIPVESKGLINAIRLAAMLTCNDDATYIFDDFISYVDERVTKKFFELWRSTVRYKQILAVCHDTNLMTCLDRADISFVIQDERVSRILNPAKDLKWRNDLALAKAYLETL